MGEHKNKLVHPPDPHYRYVLTTERRCELAVDALKRALEHNVITADHTGRTADVTVYLRRALNDATYARELAQAELKEIKEKHDRAE